MIELELPDNTAESNAGRRVSQQPQLQAHSGGREAVTSGSRRVQIPLVRHQQQRPVPSAARGDAAPALSAGAGRTIATSTPSVQNNDRVAGASGLRARVSSAVGGNVGTSTDGQNNDQINPAAGARNGSGGTGERSAGSAGANGRTAGGSDTAADANADVARELPGGVVGAGGISGRVPVSTSINQLHKASVVGDLASISRFIKDGGNLEAQSFCGRTALHYAAFYGHADVARALILAGANVCSRGGGNSTPLHFAAWGGNKKVVRLLLDYGADVEARDTEGNAPQAYSEDEELFQMLVEARLKPFPLPFKFLCRVIENHPVVSLGMYTTGLVAVASVALALAQAWTSGSAAAGHPMLTAETVASTVDGGLTSGALVLEDAIGEVGEWGMDSVPAQVFGWITCGVLILGLAPGLILAVGYKRRTTAFWRSVKERDREILRLRHREQQLAGTWIPPSGLQVGVDPAAVAAGVGAGIDGAGGSRFSIGTAGTGAAGVGVSPVTPAAVAAAADAFMNSSPRQISRGEQAGQAVMARLSRLQQTAAAGGSGSFPGLGSFPGSSLGRVAASVNPRGLSAHSAAHAHRQALQAAEFARHQQEMRRYQQAIIAAGGTLPAGNVGFGMVGNGASPAMAGAVGRGLGYAPGMGGVIPGPVDGAAGSASGGGGGGRGVATVQVAQ